MLLAGILAVAVPRRAARDIVANLHDEIVSDATGLTIYKPDGSRLRFSLDSTHKKVFGEHVLIENDRRYRFRPILLERIGDE